MRYAVDSQGEFVSIAFAEKCIPYFCRECREQLDIKGHSMNPPEGERVKHFAHKKSKEHETFCPETSEGKKYVTNDMSEWHIAWQDRFPPDVLEVWRSFDHQWGRADVLFEGNKTVIEFQHSRLSKEEFNRRNGIYLALGYRVIWLFDFTERFNDDRIRRYRPPQGSSWAKALEVNKEQVYALDFYEMQFGDFRPQDNGQVIVCFSWDYFKDGQNSTAFRRICYVNTTSERITATSLKGSDGFLGLCCSQWNGNPSVSMSMTAAVPSVKPEVTSVSEAFAHFGPDVTAMKLKNTQTNQYYIFYAKLIQYGRITGYWFGSDKHSVSGGKECEVYYTERKQWIPVSVRINGIWYIYKDKSEAWERLRH